MDYLFENKKRIAGVFLTHGHADAIGALPNLLADAKVPVFGSELTIELAKLFVKNNDAVKKFNDFHVIDENTEIEFGKTVVSFFRTTHSIPESLGIVIKTRKGSIVYTGDFKFDQSASPSYATDFGRLAEIGREGVLALLSDSANADSSVQVARSTMRDSSSLPPAKACPQRRFLRRQRRRASPRSELRQPKRCKSSR